MLSARTRLLCLCAASDGAINQRENHRGNQCVSWNLCSAEKASCTLLFVSTTIRYTASLLLPLLRFSVSSIRTDAAVSSCLARKPGFRHEIPFSAATEPGNCAIIRMKEFINVVHTKFSGWNEGISLAVVGIFWGWFCRAHPFIECTVLQTDPPILFSDAIVQPASPGCSSRVWVFPNKRFATQMVFV